jgi:hypothetical protein
LTRTALAVAGGALTRMATASRFPRSAITASSEEGSGIGSSSSAMPAKCKANASAAIDLASSRSRPAVDAARKVREGHAVVAVGILVNERNVLAHGYLSLIRACRSMLFNVPIGRSRFGCGTVTRPAFTGCLKWMWLPFWATCSHPSARRAASTSRLCMTETYNAHEYT